MRTDLTIKVLEYARIAVVKRLRIVDLHRIREYNVFIMFRRTF